MMWMQQRKKSGHVGIISVGWDPGMFSLNRMYANAILPEGKDYTFWGKGVSQGHSDAIRRVEGVKDGKQYTIPVEVCTGGSAEMERIRSLLQDRNIQESVLWFWKKVLMQQKWKRRLRLCQTILQIMTQRFILSAKKN